MFFFQFCRIISLTKVTFCKCQRLNVGAFSPPLSVEKKQMPVRKCWHGWVTPERARPAGPRMPAAQDGLTLEYIYLGCGEEVGASSVLHRAMATVAETDAYGSHRSRAAVITAGSARGPTQQADGWWLVGESQLWAGLWARESRQQGCGRRGKTHCCCICCWLQPFQAHSPVPGAWKLS